MFFRTSGKLVLMVALAVGAGAVPAKSESAERSTRSFASLINVDALIDNYLRFVARKYSLTEEQDAYTEQLVRARVDEFLNRHYDELADLFERLIMVRNGGEVAPDELIEWGRRIQPIYQEAKGIIIQTNDDWRGILNEEQRRMHDEDVQLMYESFSTTEDQLSRLTAGQMSVEEFRNPRAARQSRQQASGGQQGAGARTASGRVGSATGHSKTPGDADIGARKPGAKTPAGGTAQGKHPGGAAPGAADKSAAATRGARQRGGAAAGGAGESQWEQYVRQFIERYKLNEEQVNRANKILKSCQDQAERYRRGRAEQFERLDRQEAALRTSDNPNKAKEQEEITAQRAKLMAPIESIFDKQLKPRLEKIPTRAQREAAEKSGPPEKGASAKPAGGKVPPAPGAQPTSHGKGPTAAPPGRHPPTLEETPDNPDSEEEEDEETEGEKQAGGG